MRTKHTFLMLFALSASIFHIQSQTPKSTLSSAVVSDGNWVHRTLKTNPDQSLIFQSYTPLASMDVHIDVIDSKTMKKSSTLKLKKVVPKKARFKSHSIFFSNEHIFLFVNYLPQKDSIYRIELRKYNMSGEVLKTKLIKKYHKKKSSFSFVTNPDVSSFLCYKSQNFNTQLSNFFLMNLDGKVTLSYDYDKLVKDKQSDSSKTGKKKPSFDTSMLRLMLLPRIQKVHLTNGNEIVVEYIMESWNLNSYHFSLDNSYKSESYIQQISGITYYDKLNSNFVILKQTMDTGWRAAGPMKVKIIDDRIEYAYLRGIVKGKTFTGLNLCYGFLNLKDKTDSLDRILSFTKQGSRIITDPDVLIRQKEDKQITLDIVGWNSTASTFPRFIIRNSSISKLTKALDKKYITINNSLFSIEVLSKESRINHLLKIPYEGIFLTDEPYFPLPILNVDSRSLFILLEETLNNISYDLSRDYARNSIVQYAQKTALSYIYLEQDDARVRRAALKLSGGKNRMALKANFDFLNLRDGVIVYVNVGKKDLNPKGAIDPVIKMYKIKFN